MLVFSYFVSKTLKQGLVLAILNLQVLLLESQSGRGTRLC